MILTILLALIGVNLATIALFWLDKQAAIKRHRRISEKTLLTFALIGGTPGAFYAQHRFRHKTQKQPFKTFLIVIAGAQVIFAVACLFYPELWQSAIEAINL